MSSLSSYNTENVTPSSVNEPIPAGYYPAMIVASELKATQSGGTRLALTVQVIDGVHVDRRVFTGLNLVCPSSKKAEEFAMRDLAAIRLATGVAGDDSEEFHDETIVVKVKIDPAQNGYDAKNEISGWLEANEKTVELCAKTETENEGGGSTEEAKKPVFIKKSIVAVKRIDKEEVVAEEVVEDVVDPPKRETTGKAKPAWFKK